MIVRKFASSCLHTVDRSVASACWRFDARSRITLTSTRVGELRRDERGLYLSELTKIDGADGRVGRRKGLSVVVV
jgi:hypothetical protein